MFGRKRAEQELLRVLDRCQQLASQGHTQFAVQLNLLEAGGGRSRIYAFIDAAQDLLAEHGFAVTAIDVAEWEYTATFAVMNGRAVAASAPAATPSAPTPPPAASAQGGIQFDPRGPENAGNAADDAYKGGNYRDSFYLYVKSIDRLHDFYVYESFRNRQPSPRDKWLIEGLVSSLSATRRFDAGADVRDGVREATHRLRTIATACDRAGANGTMYRDGLDGLARNAPEVDVSDIFWE